VYRDIDARLGGVEPATALAAALAAVRYSLMWIDRDYVVRGISLPDAERVVGADMLTLITPESRPAAVACLERVARTRECGEYEARRLDGSGRSIVFDTRAAPMVSGDELVGFMLHTLDVNDQRTMARRLALAEVATGLGLWTFDVATGRVEWNDQMRAIMGRGDPLPLAAYIDEAVHPDDRERLRAESQRSMATGDVQSAPHRIVRPDGAVRWVLTMGQIEHDAGGGPVFMHGVSVDVTAQRAREEQLHEARRLEAVGQLSAGVAHNFNNLLAVILPALEQARDEGRLDHREAMSDAHKAAQRAADLVEQMLVLGRPRSTGRALDLAMVVAAAARLGEQAAAPAVRVQLEVAHTPMFAEGVAGQLGQAILNMVVNARDAIGDRDGGGCVTITLAPGSGERALGEAGTARITVTDDGPGMVSAVRDRVFEPFFSQRPNGRGTGLGLSTAHATVAAMGGTLECRSTPGRGTTFVMDLPLVAPPRRASATPSPSPRTRALRVLVVDDEPGVLRTVMRAFERGGLVVRGAGGADDALAQLREHEFDVLVVDRSMPGMDGIELARHVRRLRPELPVALLTGGPVEAGESELFDLVLAKPFRPSALVDAITRLVT
jgi:PAS domain S-box-containing protein